MRMNMSSLFAKLRSSIAALAIAGAVLASTTQSFADKLHLKDGRVLEGTVVKKGEGFLFFKVKVGSIESEQLFTTDQITKLEVTPAATGDEAASSSEAAKTESSAKTDAAKAESGEGTAAPAAKAKGSATRVAILNFGPPSSWQGEVGNMVGSVITAKSWKAAIKPLQDDGVQVVIVRVNSGGGALAELHPFHEVFEEYKKKFRTVGWIESAISCAAMSPWVLEEFYFMPEGNMGACTGWSGNLVAMKGWGLEMVFKMMEDASAMANNRSPYIMRAMQIQEPLSVDFDALGNPVWRQDEDGELVLNTKGRVFTMTKDQALKSKFAKGVAANVPELMKAMNINEYEIVGQKATDLVDKSMREADKAEKRFEEVLIKYSQAVGFAAQAQDKKKRGEFIAAARRHLEELERLFRANRYAAGGREEEWFQEQRNILKELAGP